MLIDIPKDVQNESFSPANRTVVLITGDGSFLMTCQEVAAARGLRAGRITVIDCILETRDHVYPMVTGSSLMDYVE